MGSPAIVHRAVEPRPDTAVDVIPDGEFEFHFLSGRLSLDLVATVGERWDRCFERLRTPGDLRRWVVQSGIVSTPLRADRAHLDATRALRTAIGRTLIAWADGQTRPTEARAILNATAGKPDVPIELDAEGGLLQRARASMPAVLSTIARDAIDLVASGDPRRLRECAADDCSLLMYDTSRPGRRRWCSMQGCGNRHKAAQYRRRHTDHR